MENYKYHQYIIYSKRKEWLHYNVLMLLKTPQLPDLNTIEHLWREFKDQLENCNIKNKESGKENFSNTKINAETSAGSRIDTHGNAIKY